MSDRTSASPLERLRRWEIAGGGWRIVTADASGAEVLLERCDLGEAIGSISSADRDFVAYVKALEEHGDG